MAWYSPNNIGAFQLNMVKPEYMEELGTYFNYFTDKPLPVTYFDNHYVKQPPLQHTDLFLNFTTQDKVGGVVILGYLKDGKYLGAEITDIVELDGNRNWSFSADIYVYNSDGSKYSAKKVVSFTHRAGTQYSPKNWSPLYFSMQVDDESKKAKYCVLCTVVQYQYETYFANNTTYDYDNSGYLTQSEFYEIMKGSVKEYDPDPWSNSGYAGIGGGGGAFDFKSDTIALPDLPTLDAVSSGFLQLFSGGLPSILELSKYMWSSSFFDSVVKITSNPIDIIMGLYMYPFIVPATNRKYIRAGNVITNIVMNVPDSQIIEIDCGSVEVPNFYGAYLDYEPFTKCDLFLPYCGTFPLSMDDIAGKTLTIKYRVDLLTGVCGAYVIINESVKYNYTGTCAINIPISSRSFENLYNSIMSVVGSMIGGSSFGLPSVGSVAGAVTSGKNQIQHGGNCSGNAGYLGVQTPYLIFSVPNVAIPKGLNTYTGYPIFATYKLADLKGYTEVEEIHLENLGSATKEEIDMIINKLKEGVIL